MSGIKLPIEVGQKYLRGTEVGEILTTTRNHPHFPIVWMGLTSGNIGEFDSAGRWFCDRDSVNDLRPIPVTITEGVPFSGKQYHEEFIRLRDAGSVFEYKNRTGEWCPRANDSDDPTEKDVYRLLPAPRHLDANGNPLKVGDRVEVSVGGERRTINSFSNNTAYLDGLSPGSVVLIKECRKLRTVKRPLCAADLDAAKHPQMLLDGCRGYPMWSEKYVLFNGFRRSYDQLEVYQWRPSADQPWGPCEVEEEVLA